jgi:hypothetical protein
MATSREEIVVRAGFDNTALANGLRSAGGMLTNFATSIAGQFTGMFAVFKLIQFEKSMMDLGDTITDTAKRLGVSTDEAQRLNFAADQTGVGIEKLSGALDRLAKAKEGGKANEEFARFGISIDQIASQTPDQLFDAIAASVQKTGVNARVTADLMALMGRNAGELIPMLKELSELKGHAPIISEEDIANLHEAKQEWGYFGASMKAFSAWANSQALHPIGFLSKFMETPMSYDMQSKQAELARRDKEKAAAAAIVDAKKKTDLDDFVSEYKKYNDDLRNKELTTQEKITAEREAQAEHVKVMAENEKIALDYQKGIRSKIASLTEGTIPTLNDLAGRPFDRQLGRDYGAGGRWDLTRGDGPNGNVARDYLKTQKEAQYDFTYGNKGQYDKDLTKLGGLKGTLMDLGILPDTRDMRDISTATAASEKHLAALNDSLKTGNATINIKDAK